MAWEYRIVHFAAETGDEEDFDARLHENVHYLNELGSKGWEMVGFLPHPAASRSTRYHAVLKRLKG